MKMEVILRGRRDILRGRRGMVLGRRRMVRGRRVCCVAGIMFHVTGVVSSVAGMAFCVAGVYHCGRDHIPRGSRGIQCCRHGILRGRRLSVWLARRPWPAWYSAWQVLARAVGRNHMFGSARLVLRALFAPAVRYCFWMASDAADSGVGGGARPASCSGWRDICGDRGAYRHAAVDSMHAGSF